MVCRLSKPVLDGSSCEYDQELNDYVYQLVEDVLVDIKVGCPEASEDIDCTAQE